MQSDASPARKECASELTLEPTRLLSISILEYLPNFKFNALIVAIINLTY